MGFATKGALTSATEKKREGDVEQRFYRNKNEKEKKKQALKEEQRF